MNNTKFRRVISSAIAALIAVSASLPCYADSVADSAAEDPSAADELVSAAGESDSDDGGAVSDEGSEEPMASAQRIPTGISMRSMQTKRALRRRSRLREHRFSTIILLRGARMQTFPFRM